MPPTGRYPPDWELFTHQFATLHVDPSRPGFQEKWRFILAWAYRKRSLNAAHKQGVKDSPLPVVRWLGGEKPPQREPTMTLLW